MKSSDYNAKVLRGREGDATFSSIANSGRMANGLTGPVHIFVSEFFSISTETKNVSLFNITTL